MKKTSLALITAVSILGSVAVHAEETGTASGGTSAEATGGITSGAVGAGAVVAGAVVASNASDGNPLTSTSTVSGTTN